MVQDSSLPGRLQLQALAVLTLAEASFAVTGADLEARLEMFTEGYTAEELGNGATMALHFVLDREARRAGLPVSGYIAEVRREIMAIDLIES